MAIQLLEALLPGEEGIVDVDDDADVVLENFVQGKVRPVLAADDRRDHDCNAADGHTLRIEQVVRLTLVVDGRVDGLSLGLRHHAGGAEVAVDNVVRHDRQSVADVGVELDPSVFFLRLEFLWFIVLKVDHAVGLDLVFLFIFKERRELLLFRAVLQLRLLRVGHGPCIRSVHVRCQLFDASHLHSPEAIGRL